MHNVLTVVGTDGTRFLIRALLENCGFRVIGEASNGGEAVQLYQKLKPDLVTIGLTNTEPNGFETLGMLKFYDHNARVVMISGTGRSNLIQKAIAGGVSAFIVKPFITDFDIKVFQPSQV